MGTILNDFFYQERYASDFDRMVNEYIRKNISGLNKVSDLSLVGDFYLKTLEYLYSYCLESRKLDRLTRKVDDLSGAKDKALSDIDTLNIADSELTNHLIQQDDFMGQDLGFYADLVRNTKHKRLNEYSELEDELFDHEYRKNAAIARSNAMYDALIELYDRLNALLAKKSLNKSGITLNYDDVEYLRAELAVHIKDKAAVDYLSDSIYMTIVDELDYLIEIYKSLDILSTNELTPQTVIMFRNELKRAECIKGALEIKKELLEIMYQKLYHSKAKNSCSLIAEEQEQFDSATCFIRYMIDHKDLYAGLIHLVAKTKKPHKSKEAKEIYRKLSGLYDQNIKVRVIK